uniref:Oxysterol binding protein like 10 n=1 Tax=Pipistrellus kuhlii TaxID=59472 RepID=A0A7J7WE02_PIPKU|nr:oxysterol binding protein like 10 [Pipistrellus kuhlii]
MERPAQGADGGGGGSHSSSRSSSRATSAGSSPSCSLAGRGISGRSAAVAGLGGGGGSRSSPGSVAASPSGGDGGRRREPALEGVLSKYTNLLQGWQNREEGRVRNIDERETWINSHWVCARNQDTCP